jgi:hypothetical protein
MSKKTEKTKKKTTKKGIKPEDYDSRMFWYDGIDYDDPGEQFTIEEIQGQLASTFPALVDGKTQQEVKGRVLHVTFEDAPKSNA